MKLISVTVEDFRSIRSARKIPIRNFTTLIGPNNEGKSNILRALFIGMRALRNYGRISARLGPARRLMGAAHLRRQLQGEFQWDIDYPVTLQPKLLQGTSNVTLEFQLSDVEVDEFYEATKSTLNGTLPIQLKFGKDDVVAVVAKQGRAHKSLNAKIAKILEFISKRIDIQYIPAVRTASNVDDIVDRLVERALEPTERMQEYQDAVAKIRDLQQPILDQLGETITQTISGFIPGLKSAKLISTNEQRVSAIRSTIDIVVDDGVPTPLRYKGDGVQSLVALAMMRQSSHGDSRSNLDTVCTRTVIT